MFEGVNRKNCSFFPIVQSFEEGESFTLEDAIARHASPTAGKTRIAAGQFNAVHIDSAHQATLVRQSPACRKGIALANTNAREGGARTNHPLDNIDIAFASDDGNAIVGFAANLRAFAGVVAADVADFCFQLRDIFGSNFCLRRVGCKGNQHKKRLTKHGNPLSVRRCEWNVQLLFDYTPV